MRWIPILMLGLTLSLPTLYLPRNIPCGNATFFCGSFNWTFLYNFPQHIQASPTLLANDVTGHVNSVVGETRATCIQPVKQHCVYRLCLSPVCIPFVLHACYSSNTCHCRFSPAILQLRDALWEHIYILLVVTERYDAVLFKTYLFNICAVTNALLPGSFRTNYGLHFCVRMTCHVYGLVLFCNLIQ